LHPVWSDDWPIDEEEDLMDQFTVDQLPATHPAIRYFGYGQNDAEVLDLSHGADFLELKLSHYDIGRLACKFVENPRMSWPVLRLAFPVTLRFEGISEYVVLRCVEQGVYQNIRNARRSVGRSVDDVVRMECVFYEPNLQRYILRVNGAIRYRIRRGNQTGFSFNNEYVLCIEAAAVTVKEGYREGWTRVFKGEHLDVLNAFESVWPVTSWGMQDFEQWLLERQLDQADTSSYHKNLAAHSGARSIRELTPKPIIAPTITM
jgi:hypothetical protein